MVNIFKLKWVDGENLKRGVIVNKVTLYKVKINKRKGTKMNIYYDSKDWFGWF